MIRTIKSQVKKSDFSTLISAKNAESGKALAMICGEFRLAFPATQIEEWELTRRIDILSEFQEPPAQLHPEYWEFNLSFIAAWKDPVNASVGQLALTDRTAEYNGEILDVYIPQEIESVAITHDGALPSMPSNFSASVARFESRIIQRSGGSYLRNYWLRVH